MVINKKNAYWLLLSLVAFVLDQWTKQLITAHFDYREVLPIFALGESGFNLTLAHNYGAAFSFLADQSGWQRWFFCRLGFGGWCGNDGLATEIAAGQHFVGAGFITVDWRCVW